jgi:hypothetical protein
MKDDGDCNDVRPRSPHQLLRGQSRALGVHAHGLSPRAAPTAPDVNSASGGGAGDASPVLRQQLIQAGLIVPVRGERPATIYDVPTLTLERREFDHFSAALDDAPAPPTKEKA